MTGSSRDIIEFTLIYNKHKKKLFNYVLKMINDQMLTEDIVQNVFLKLYEKIGTIRNRNSITYWLFTTARNEIYTIFRNKKVRVDQYNVQDTDDLEINSNDDLEKTFELNEMKEIILKELDTLPEEQREVYYLKEYGEMSYKEIAGIMEIDEGLVKSRLFKTRQKLIKRLSKKVKE